MKSIFRKILCIVLSMTIAICVAIPAMAGCETHNYDYANAEGPMISSSYLTETHHYFITTCLECNEKGGYYVYHKFDTSYVQSSDEQHTKNLICVDTDLSSHEEFSGMGCGYTISTLEEHTVNLTQINPLSNTQHEIVQYCICGYVISTETVEHDTQYGEWESVDDTHHERDVVCDTCGYNSTELSEHNFISSEWTDTEDGHQRINTCTDCTYSETETHQFIYEAWEYIPGGFSTTYDPRTYHMREIHCSTCEYTSFEYEEHSFTEFTEWEYDSDQRHTRNRHCTVCGHKVIQYFFHEYPTENYFYEVSSTDEHILNKLCSGCGYITSSVEAHDFEYSDWSYYDSLSEYNDDYYFLDYHARTKTCTDCGYSENEFENHAWVTDGKWAYDSEQYHYQYKTCSICDNRVGTYRAHTYSYENYSYEQYNEQQHKVTKPCDDCEHEIIEYSNHVDTDNDDYCDECNFLISRFSVTVPTTMSIVVSKDGEVYTATNAAVSNNSTSAVSVSQVNIVSINGWTIVPYDYNISQAKVDSKLIGFSINTVKSDVTAINAEYNIENSWIIDKENSLDLTYDAIVSATSVPVVNEQVLDIVFIVDWV